MSPAAPRSLRRADALCPLFLLFPVSLDAGGRQENKPDLKAALFNRRWSEAYVSPFKTARQFCSSWRLPFACFSSSSASSTKFFSECSNSSCLKIYQFLFCRFGYLFKLLTAQLLGGLSLQYIFVFCSCFVQCFIGIFIVHQRPRPSIEKVLSCLRLPQVVL